MKYKMSKQWRRNIERYGMGTPLVGPDETSMGLSSNDNIHWTGVNPHLSIGRTKLHFVSDNRAIILQNNKLCLLYYKGNKLMGEVLE